MNNKNKKETNSNKENILNKFNFKLPKELKIDLPKKEDVLNKIKPNKEKVEKPKVEKPKVEKVKKEKTPKIPKIKVPKVEKPNTKIDVKQTYNDIATKAYKRIEFIKKPFIFLSNSFETLFKDPRMLRIFSFIVALLLFAMVMYRGNQLTSGSSAEILRNVPVEVRYNEEIYVVEGVPDTVELLLVGSKTDLTLVKALGKYKVYIDLTDLGPGTHTVELKYENISNVIQTKIEPSAIKVKISDRTTNKVAVTHDIVRKDKMDPKLTIENIELSVGYVNILGAKEKIDSVVTVRALIDASLLKDPGKTTIDNIPLVAYDSKGQVVNVDILPVTISAVVDVSQSSKEIPIEVIPEGKLAEGYSVTDITTNISTVVVYAPNSVLENLSSIPVKIDVTELKEDKKFQTVLEMPTGVTFMSESKVEVSVKLDKTITKELTLEVSQKNKPEGYVVNAKTLDDKYAKVIIKGAESILNNITETSGDIKAYIDLEGKTSGEHICDLIITIYNPLITDYELVKYKVTVILKKKEA